MPSDTERLTWLEGRMAEDDGFHITYTPTEQDDSTPFVVWEDYAEITAQAPTLREVIDKAMDAE